MSIWSFKTLHAFNYKILLSCLLVSSISACTTYSEKDLYGTWASKSEETEIVITFNQDSTWEYVYNDNTGSKAIQLTGDYEVNFSKQPIPLTIRNIPQLNHPLHTIIQFRKPDVLRMAEFAPRWRIRPISFNRETEIILKRNNK